MEKGQVLQERYQVEEYLGEGATGPVFLCRDLHLPGKQWAVKEMIGDQPLGREVEIMLGLRHRNLPAVIDHFTENEKTFLVLEFVEGENLTYTVDQEGRVNKFEALRWGLEIARVLSYLHGLSRPVLFRDLRPERVIVTPARHIKLVDFGLARYLEPGQRITQSRGAVAFTAPEQWQAPGSEDSRSDIYSLGATLYYALTGKAPTPAGGNSLAEERPDLSRGTVALIEKCMHPDTDKRFQDANTVTLQLEQLLRGARAERRLPHRVPLLAGLVVMVTLLVVAGWWSGRRPPQSSQSPHHQMRDQAELLMGRGQYEEAIGLLDKLVTNNPRDALAQLLLQNAYARLSGASPTTLPVISSMTPNQDGYELLYGFTLAQAEINRRGGINGRPLLFDLFEDQNRVEQAISQAQTVIRAKQYPLCLGLYSSQNTLAVAQLFNTARLPLLTPVACDPRVFDAGPYVFSIADTDRRRVEHLAQYFLGEGQKKAAVVFHEKDVASRTMADAFIEEFERGGAEITAQLGYRDFHFERVLEELERLKPDLLFIGEHRTDAVKSFTSELRAVSLKPALGIATVPFEAPEGAILTTQYRPGDDPFSTEFRRMFGGRNPSIRAAQAYDAVHLAARLLAEANLPEKIRERLAEARIDGASGPFAPGRAINLRPIYLVEIQDGEPVFSPPVY